MSAKKLPTAAELNAQAAAFWADPVNQRINDAIYQHEVALAGIEQINQQKVQTRRGRLPRPGARKPEKALVVDAMRGARANGLTLPQFIDSMESGDEIEIIKPTLERDTYTIEAEALKESVSVTYVQLEEWWKQAGRKGGGR